MGRYNDRDIRASVAFSFLPRFQVKKLFIQEPQHADNKPNRKANSEWKPKRFHSIRAVNVLHMQVGAAPQLDNLFESFFQGSELSV